MNWKWRRRMSTKTSPALTVLHRLKRRFGWERARLDRWEQEARQEGRTQSADRCYYEATQWSVAMGMIDDEIEKARKGCAP